MAKKIIVASGKGGAGKTSFATGLAISLVAKGQSVLIVDCDIGQGCIDFMLEKADSMLYNWGDALKERCTCNEAVCKTANSDFISAPPKWSDEFTEEKFKKFIKVFEDAYDFIIFDSPAGIGGGFLLAASCADRGIIISTPDEICTSAASKAADELISKGIDDVRLVINRFNRTPVTSGKLLNVDEVIDAVKIQLIGVVPEDDLITYASSSGLVSVENSPAKAAFMRIADRVLGKKVNLVLAASKKEKLSKLEPIKIVLTVLFAIIVVLAGLFTVDFFRCKELKTPVFAQPVSVDTDNTAYYSALFYVYTVERNNVKITRTEMKIGDKVIAAQGVKK